MTTLAHTLLYLILFNIVLVGWLTFRAYRPELRAMLIRWRIARCTRAAHKAFLAGRPLTSRYFRRRAEELEKSI